MAESDQQEKTEQPTPKRIRDAREKGQVPRSRELTAMAVTLAGAGALIMMRARLGAGLADVMRSGLTPTRQDIFDVTAMAAAFGAAVKIAAGLFTPLAFLVMGAALGAPLLLGGWSFSAKAFAFKADKLNPIEGLKRIFALRGLVELVKALAKFGVVAGVTAALLYHLAPRFLALGREPLHAAAVHAADLTGLVLLALGAALALIAAVDVPFQLWDYTQKLRMTRQEIRDEFKETEGRPEVKQHIRNLQQQTAKRRMMEEVPRASVIITNPTHFAVALRYDQNTMAAPRLVAKGADHMAAQIRAVGAANRVALVQAPPLARALYRNTEIGQDIPVGLYLAVAEVLTYVYQLREAMERGGEPPEPPAPGIASEYTDPSEP